MKITPHQIKNLLNNAYGFTDEFNTLYQHHVYEIDEDVIGGIFKLIDHANGVIDILSFDNAEVINGSVSFYSPITEDFRMYTILVVATDGSNLLPQLLGE
jgi:hypothetical protein